MKTARVSQSIRTFLRLSFVAATLAFLGQTTVRAGGNESAYYDLQRLQQMKTHEEVDALKVGDTIVRSCPNCGNITIFTLKKSLKGNYELLSPKCELCGKTGVIVGAKTATSFKESVKR